MNSLPDPVGSAKLKTCTKCGEAKDRGEFGRDARRDRVAKAVNDLTAEQWNAIIESQSGRCAICGTAFGLLHEPTRDHIIPVSKGGGLTASNVMALCRPCNSSKSANVIDIRSLKHKPREQASETD